MGITGSRVASKIASAFGYGASDDGDDPDAEARIEAARRALQLCNNRPLVYKRTGSMYFDEDGDLAHEFYEEVKKKGKVKMKRVNQKHLTPQGEVPYPHPRLHVDFPIILYQG